MSEQTCGHRVLLLVAALSATMGFGQAGAASLNCSHSFFTDDVALCGDAHLSELDGLISSAYAEAERRGLAVFSAKRAFFREVRECDRNKPCIQRSQLGYLISLGAMGIVVPLPSWIQGSHDGNADADVSLSSPSNASPTIESSSEGAPRASETEKPLAVERAGFLVSDSLKSVKYFKTYDGHVAWFRKPSAQETDKLAGLSGRISIPGLSLRADVSFEKGTPKDYKISYFVSFAFQNGSAEALKDIDTIDMLGVRLDNKQLAHILLGSLVKVQNNRFLIAIEKTDTESRLADVLAKDGWFDIPILFQSGFVGKLTFEGPRQSSETAITPGLASGSR